ncbi:hypothetical protein [Paraburkholderia sp. A3RO-2L]|uniref:hypothetical protein n=1 Tax=Paraburkholderia sp. A3RO-2L TaxID=3028376 RepID=UPI003DA7FCE4
MSLQLFVPPLGTKLRLVEPWDFSLFNERRNATLMALLGDTRKLEYHDVEGIPATLPAGTVLIIDRYYIRHGLDEFDSVSFRMQGVSAEAKTYSFSAKATRRQVRFWAKLPDVNNMCVDVIEAEDTRSTV